MTSREYGLRCFRAWRERAVLTGDWMSFDYWDAQIIRLTEGSAR